MKKIKSFIGPFSLFIIISSVVFIIANGYGKFDNTSDSKYNFPIYKIEQRYSTETDNKWNNVYSIVTIIGKHEKKSGYSYSWKENMFNRTISGINKDSILDNLKNEKIDALKRIKEYKKIDTLIYLNTIN